MTVKEMSNSSRGNDASSVAAKRTGVGVRSFPHSCVAFVSEPGRHIRHYIQENQKSCTTRKVQNK